MNLRNKMTLGGIKETGKEARMDTAHTEWARSAAWARRDETMVHFTWRFTGSLWLELGSVGFKSGSCCFRSGYLIRRWLAICFDTGWNGTM